MNNSFNVKQYIFGNGSLSKLPQLLEDIEASNASKVVYFIDDYFRNHELLGRLPIVSEDEVLFVDTVDEPKVNKEYIYYYRDNRPPYKGNWRNTAGWTSVEIAGKIIEKIGPILATKYIEVN